MASQASSSPTVSVPPSEDARGAPDDPRSERLHVVVDRRRASEPVKATDIADAKVKLAALRK